MNKNKFLLLRPLSRVHCHPSNLWPGWNSGNYSSSHVQNCVSSIFPFLKDFHWALLTFSQTLPHRAFLKARVTEETIIEKDTCTPMFIEALFTIAKTWKQPECPSTNEWIKKLWYTYTMEYYSAIKGNTFESVLIRWINLEPIIQSEVSLKEKYKYCTLTHIYGI